MKHVAKHLPELVEQEPQRRGYLARELVQCTLPHSNTKGQIMHQRQDGNLTVTISARPDIGLPYGTIPRLLMLWITSEAMRTRERKLNLGNSLSQLTTLIAPNGAAVVYGYAPGDSSHNR